MIKLFEKYSSDLKSHYLVSRKDFIKYRYDIKSAIDDRLLGFVEKFNISSECYINGNDIEFLNISVIFTRVGNTFDSKENCKEFLLTMKNLDEEIGFDTIYFYCSDNIRGDLKGRIENAKNTISTNLEVDLIYKKLQYTHKVQIDFTI